MRCAADVAVSIHLAHLLRGNSGAIPECYGPADGFPLAAGLAAAQCGDGADAANQRASVWALCAQHRAYPPGMIQRPEAHPGEPATPPDPLARAKNTVRRARWPAAGLVLLLILLGIAFRHGEQWGDIATWVLAATTLLAFLAAAFAGIVAYDLLKIETTRDQQAAQESALAAADRKRDHASHLSFWLTVRNIRAEHDEVYEPDAPHIEIVLHIVNTSDRPAMSLTATAGYAATCGATRPPPTGQSWTSTQSSGRRQRSHPAEPWKSRADCKSPHPSQGLATTTATTRS